MIIRYVKVKDKPIGCVVGLSADRIGWSLCCKKDVFNKKMARMIAMGRANNDRHKEIPHEIVKTHIEVHKRLHQQS